MYNGFARSGPRFRHRFVRLALVRRFDGTTILLFRNRLLENSYELRCSTEMPDLTRARVLDQVLRCAAVIFSFDPHPQQKQMRRSMRIELFSLTTCDRFLYDGALAAHRSGNPFTFYICPRVARREVYKKATKGDKMKPALRGSRTQMRFPESGKAVHANAAATALR